MPNVWRPNCVFNLELRFDEALHVVTTPDPVSVEARVANPPGDDVRNLINNLSTQEPLITQRGDGNVSYVLNRLPKKATVELPGYRQAGNFEITLPFVDLPLDPRTLRAAKVDIHLGAVSDDDFAAGMRGRGPNGARRSIIRTRDDAGRPNQNTLLMLGLVDEMKVRHTQQGSEVTLHGRDYRGILLDSPLNPQALAGLYADFTIDKLVAQLISFHPFGDRFTVLVNPAEWPNGEIPSPLNADVLPRHRRGARGNRRGGRTNVPGSSQQMTFWDAIVQYCYLVGAIPYFSGSDLRIRPTRSIFDQQRAGFDPSIATPFLPDAPRTPPGGAPFSVRRMVYGRGIKEIEFTRRFAGNARPHVVRCVSVDTSNGSRGTGMVIQAQWPQPANDTRTRAARTTSVSPGGQQAHEEVLTIAVPGIRDQARLLVIARNLFEEIGRNEIGGTCETNDLASFGGSNQDPDLLRLRPGDGIEFYTDTRRATSGAPLVGTIVDSAREPFDQAVRRVARTIGQEDLARVIVATARGQVSELQTFFRVSNVKFDWDHDKGVGIGFDFQNYFVQRFGNEQGIGSTPSVDQIHRQTVPTGQH